MSRTVIDLDDETTEELMRVYNVKTKAAAVRRAMEEAAKLHRRMEFMDAIDSGAIDLTYDARAVDSGDAA
ncbi:type II toxin-antitoxin system VapB family antitoxin [Streptomyces sparsogenes]|nr:type II toxin-antitoxin system VapB family antitoxin [Streptomyces sparsogenes]